MKNTKLNIVPRFAIIDGAKANDELADIFQSVTRKQCLYRGESENKLASVAPYLLFFTPDDPFLPLFLNHGIAQSWGIFISTTAEMEEVMHHFRKFLIVDTEDDKKMYFRFYDPRVLHIFLSTCNEQQLQEFFGPIDYILAEIKENPSHVIAYSYQQHNLQADTISFADFLSTPLSASQSTNEQNPAQLAAEKQDDSQKEDRPKKRTFL